MTFKFFLLFCSQLGDNVPISCLLKGLTSKHSFCWQDLRECTLPAPGVSLCVGPWHAGSVGKWVHFPIYWVSTSCQTLWRWLIKTIKTVNLTPTIPIHQPFIFQPGYPHPFLGYDHFSWRCGFVTVMGLGWVSPCWGIFWEDLPCFDKRKCEQPKPHFKWLLYFGGGQDSISIVRQGGFKMSLVFFFNLFFLIM